MISLPPALVTFDELPADARWRLISSLYAQKRSLVEGSVAQLIVVLICLHRTGWRGYWVVLALVLGTLAVRFWLAIRFERRAGTDRTGNRQCLGYRQTLGYRQPPEYWARQFAMGAAMTAVLWGVTTACTCLLFDDPPLQLFVGMIQAGWLSGACIRNAASPAAVMAQALTTMLPGFCTALLARSGFMHLVAPFYLLQFSATVSIAKYLTTQLASLLKSEQRLEAANERLMLLSSTDGLTGIGNRRAFDAVLQTEWARAVRNASELALLVVDVDHFKRFNDMYGHPAGDDCLRMIAQTIESTLRKPPDFAGRFGGEEFVGLMPGTTEAEARAVAERLRAAIAEAGLHHAASPFGVVTISIGVASMVPKSGNDQQILIMLADKALYEAKRTGRNTVYSSGRIARVASVAAAAAAAAAVSP